MDWFKSKKVKKQLHFDWIIKPKLPWYKRINVLISLFVVLLSIISSYGYLRYTIKNTRSELNSITRKYDRLKQRFLDMKTAKIRLQRELEITKQSQVEVNGNLIDLHQKAQDLTEQVDLYKRVMSANSASESVSIENIQIRQIDQSNEYFLSWVLLQASKNKRDLLMGKLDIKLSGILNSSKNTLNYIKVALEKNPVLVYKFRDFQQFNKKIKLPENFQIEQVTINILDSHSKITKSKTYDWNKIGRQFYVAQTQNQNSGLQNHS